MYCASIKTNQVKKITSRRCEENMSENVQNLPKISGLPKGAKLKQSDIDFMKVIEAQNFERVKKLQNTKKSNLLTG